MSGQNKPTKPPKRVTLREPSFFHLPAVGVPGTILLMILGYVLHH